MRTNKGGVVNLNLKAEERHDLKKNDVESTFTEQTQSQEEGKSPIAGFEPTAASFRKSYTHLLSDLPVLPPEHKLFESKVYKFVPKMTRIFQSGTAAFALEANAIHSFGPAKWREELNCIQKSSIVLVF